MHARWVYETLMRCTAATLSEFTANPIAREDTQAFMRRVAAIEIDGCGHCKTGRWRCIGHLAADRSVVASPVRVSCRSPP